VPDFVHKPVMLAEVLELLRPKAGGRYADGTLGGGGHAEAMLATSAPTGWLSGCDRDGAAIEAAAARLARFAGRFELRRGNYRDLAEWVPAESCDGVLLDLGVSSPQLDTAERGFSFQQDGPLDMRMDVRSGPTAADVLNSATPDELATIFREFGEEREARRLARAIAEERRHRPFETTRQLAVLMERLSPRRGSKTHPATRVFQALRIAVNDELDSLQGGLRAALTILKPGGRLAVITFHSLEDRGVKEFGREATRDFTGPEEMPELRRACAPRMRWVSRKAIQPSVAEVEANPRARSAQLRVLEKL
jgi:16S rRNA (cytosine1402-N4)-methyltransferase